MNKTKRPAHLNNGEETRRAEDYGRVEFRAELGEDGKPTGRIEGLAAPFNKWSEDLGGFRERIKPGAFRSVLADDDEVTVALWNHNSDNVLGSTAADPPTLELRESKDGLEITIDPPESAHREREALARRDVSRMSFAFTVAAGGEEWTFDEDGYGSRTITEFRTLPDVSPVTYAAYRDTTVALRHLEAEQSRRTRAEHERRQKLAESELAT